MNSKDLKDLQRFVDAYNKYTECEFGDGSINIKQALAWDILGVLYTTCSRQEDYSIDDDAVDFQMSYCLSAKTLNYYIDGNLVKSEHFNSIGEMADDICGCGFLCDFDTYLDCISDVFTDLLRSGKIIGKDGKAVWNC